LGRLLLGLAAPADALVEQIHEIQRTPFLPETKRGCPRYRYMAVPAVVNAWIAPGEEKKTVDSYKVVIADSIKMSESGIFIHKDDLADHLVARHEHVFKCVLQ
jgi:hypothetical protein